MDYLIEIDPDALTSASLSVYRAPNGVILVRYVPVVALKGLRAITMVGKRFEAQSCELLGVPAREPEQG